MLTQAPLAINTDTQKVYECYSLQNCGQPISNCASRKTSGHLTQANQKEGGIPDEFTADYKSKTKAQPNLLGQSF